GGGRGGCGAGSGGMGATRVEPQKALRDGAIEMSSHKPRHCVTLQRDQHRAELVPGRDHDWHELMASARPVDCVPVRATDPLYILYTSGTTGKPKGVVRDNGGDARALPGAMEDGFRRAAGAARWSASGFVGALGHPS